jgi:predicted NBD/HSP70 family sugar kinase/putative N-acetylmannosamine-6-phosphate epimerase
VKIPEICRGLEGRLIVSCQAAAGNPFGNPASLARFAQEAVRGGAAGIRANGADNVRAIRQAVAVPILGIDKVIETDGAVLITPTFEGAREVVRAGADMIALDCTARGQRHGALARLQRIRAELSIPVLADIATVEEALAAAEAGADLVLSTMRGYTAETHVVTRFEPEFIREVSARVPVPVIAEGRIHSPDEARAAMEAGAFAVVVGTAITNPRELTRRFAEAVSSRAGTVGGIDLGGTNTKFGLVSRHGELLWSGDAPTPAAGGREALLAHLKRIACELVERRRPEAIGIATAGWVDTTTGTVAYATENLPGWTGTRIAAEVGEAAGIPVAVENDANALAIAEKRFGAARPFDNFVCLTLGTGVGGGCYVGGRLNRGAHYFANAIGHITLELGGLPCTCGRNGCLEVYTNQAALLRYAGPGFADAREVIRAANSGDSRAAGAIRTLAGHLAQGCASLIHLLDPEALIISGGVAQENEILFAELRERLADLVTTWKLRRFQILPSSLGYHGGVLGAAAVATATAN